MINIIIVLVGESGSGKSTLEKLICKEFEMNKLVSYTTRTKRKLEQYGKDYYFIDEEDFKYLVDSDQLIEKANYNNWNYGLCKNELEDNSVVILTPSGLRKLIEYNKTLDKPYEIVSFYINVDQRSRLIKLLERGDDIMEAIRRSLSDVGQFDDVGDETTYVISNKEYRFTPEQMLVHIEQGLSDYHLNLVHQQYGENNGSL